MKMLVVARLVEGSVSVCGELASAVRVKLPFGRKHSPALPPWPPSRSQREALSNSIRTMDWLGIEGMVTLKLLPDRVKAGDGAVAEPGGQVAAPFGLGPLTG